MDKFSNTKGFTLIEMLLVMVIVSAIIMMGIGYMQQRVAMSKVDRTAAQMQQILNAGLAYYVSNGKWPTNLACLQGTSSSDPSCSNYLPADLKSPYGKAYIIWDDTNNPNPSVFRIYTFISFAAELSKSYATMVAGKLPMAYTAESYTNTSPCGGSPICYIVASVTIPGQNLGNATSVNFAGLFHHGACVPVPKCPVAPDGITQLKPQIIVAPVSISGVFDSGDPTKVYPISSFTAYATPTASSGPPTNTSPQKCTGATFTPSCTSNNNGVGTAEAYWRVCLQLVTDKGPVTWANSATDNWGQYVTLMAITRCVVQDEKAGSNFTVYSN